MMQKKQDRIKNLMKDLEEENIRMERMNKELQVENNDVFTHKQRIEGNIDLEIEEKFKSDDIWNV